MSKVLFGALALAILGSVPSSRAFSVLPQKSTTTTWIPGLLRDSSTVRFLAAEEDEGEKTSSVKELEPDSHEELMYALGVNLARQLGDVRPLVENGEELAQVAKGLLDCVVGRMDESQQQALLSKRGKELNGLITERANRIKDKLEQAGRDMLAQMEKKEGIIKLDSGVRVDILDHGPDGPGSGQRPTQASTVKVHYHGTLADGTIFDSTLGEDPVTFPLNGVVPGWREGVLKMHEGETAMIGIPPEQAYGDEGTPDGRIPGGSTLFFKIQLLEILSAGIGGGPTLLGADGQSIKKGGGGGLLGADGKPLA
ncbi:FKBP-type 22 kDa peptidyl-prolyl cis-trans isomerase [Seminavis robusta]|uniref:peptidylprolyl isomerase n=1 Tax=Seminavis robusta TaxID=568900 RepID=A0A9N8HRZ9_9STRA|nr:FKBP-type 22 kDa peptidyl-prolyl cis-trans isomerase [Seminavis robusta]|eukprot:Sro1330_g263400.1 FKBP-type 22 kDa peptidyl-prolyl cis-trans isomerase (311) ;mRNA; f:13627-14680